MSYRNWNRHQSYVPRDHEWGRDRYDWAWDRRYPSRFNRYDDCGPCGFSECDYPVVYYRRPHSRYVPKAYIPSRGPCNYPSRYN